MNPRKLLDILLKDLLVVGKDRGSWILLLITPLAIIMVASFALGPAFSGQLKSQLLVTNLDPGQAGADLVSRLGAMEGLSVVTAGEDETINLTIGNKKYKTGLVIPADFTTLVMSGRDTKLQVYVDPNDNVNRPFMVGMIDGIASRMSGMVTSVRVAVAEVQKFSPETDANAVVADAVSMATGQLSVDPPVAAEITNAAGLQKVNMFDTQVPGYSVMFLLFGVMLGAEMLLEERDKGTLGRLMVAPVSRASILGGKLLAQFVIAMAQMTILFSVGHFVFGMNLGNSLPGLVLIVAVTALTATAGGLLLASVVRTRRQASSLGVLIVILMSALGGSWWPLSIVPRFMQVIGHFTINAWALDGINGLIIKGQGFSSILMPAGVLFLYGAVCFAIGLKMFRFRGA